MITLPLRLTVRATSLMLRGGEEIATRTLALATQAAAALRPRDEEGQRDQGGSDAPASSLGVEVRRRTSTAKSSSTPAPRPRTPENGEAIDFDAPAHERPAHLSEEPTLVAELAEPGAEDGAGAEVRVDQPWPGYTQMTADDLVARIVTADAAQLAAIQLFEAANRRRQTVLSAVERQLALVTRGS